ncbi:hypothetical protein EJB05_34656, partial [Eragrostis curvula]
MPLNPRKFAPTGSRTQDLKVPLTSTRYSIDALGLPTTASWYPWYDNKQVGGWSQVYKGLTLVTVRGAGHKVPLHRPRQALILFQHFLHGISMPNVPQNGTIKNDYANVDVVRAAKDDACVGFARLKKPSKPRRRCAKTILPLTGLTRKIVMWLMPLGLGEKLAHCTHNSVQRRVPMQPTVVEDQRA